MDSRLRILEKLRQASPTVKPELSIARYSTSNGDLLARFKLEAEAVHTEVLVAEDGRLALQKVCNDLSIQVLVIPAQCKDWLTSWESGPKLIAFEQELDEWKNELFDQVDAGFNIAEGGIADTGSLITSSATSPRSISLVPPIHICLLDPANLYPDMATAWKNLIYKGTNMQSLPSNLVLISGPSKTADIQQTLAYGAHGPKKLIVILSSNKSLKNEGFA